MAKADAVSAVTGDLFEKDWSRIRGGQGLTGERRRAQMVRAAGGHRAAVFKAIRSGGCHNRAQLANQLDYLTTKSLHIVDSRGVLDGKATLTGEEIGAVADRFARRWSDGFHPKLGQTTHMLMSFPVGTRGEDVRDIASKVCERFFANEERNFDYLIAVHEDRAHPHAHVVLNRKSQEGEFFYLGRDHHFNYDDFRIAMVEEAEKVGVRLEATRRVHRGVIDYPPRTREVYAARDEGRVPLGRERFGRDLTAAKAEVQAFAKEYGTLATKIGVSLRQDIGERLMKAGEMLALFRAGNALAEGRPLELRGAVYDLRTETLQQIGDRFTEQAREHDAMARALPDRARPQAQKQLHRANALLADVKPIGERSDLLTTPPAEDGLYSALNIRSERMDRLDDLVTRAQIETAVRGTGISPDLIVARIETGADSAALEDTWWREDGLLIAAHDGLDPAVPEHFERIRDRLDQVHGRLATALAEAGVLRTAGLAETRYSFHFDQEAFEDRCRAIRQELRDTGLDEAQIADRADEIEDRAFGEIEREQRAWIEKNPIFPSSPDELYRETEDGALVLVNEEKGIEIEEGVWPILDHAGSCDDVAGILAVSLAETFADMPDHLVRGLAQTYATAYALRMAERAHEEPQDAQKAAEGVEDRIPHRDASRADPNTEKAAPTERESGNYPAIDRTIAYEKLSAGEQMSVATPDRAAFRLEVEEALGPEGAAALRAGDADALAPVLDDRLDRLYVAKVYMQSDPDHAVATGDAMRAVCDELAEVQFEAQRLATGIVERRGLTH